MEMAGEDEVEDARLQEIDHLREVAQEDPQIRFRIGQALGLRPTKPRGAWIDAGDLDLPPAQLDRLRVVHEQPGRRQVSKLNGARKWIARDGQVVIPQHGIAARQPLEQPSKRSLAAWAREQVSADHRQIGLPLFDPGHCSLDRPHPTRRNAEMEV
jgi:hypothetical protein